MTRAPTKLDEDDTWQLAIAADDLWEGEMVGLRLAGTDVLLVKLGEHEVHAFADRCPHAGARLSEGMLCGTTLRCNAHHWDFDVRTGEGINPRTCKLARYPVQIVAGGVMVQLRVR
jgi:toluene monooxygenase system ferredoxin subunit